MHFPLRKITNFQVSSIEEISRFKKQLLKRRVENASKIPMFSAIDFMKNLAKLDQKYGLHKQIEKNTKHIDFGTILASQNALKPIQN